MREVIAKKTQQNSYCQKLFIEGKKYPVAREFENKKGIYIINELHTETPVKNFDFDRLFEEMTQ